ncbi:hypothetical protein LCGC14_1409720, partial [marine sediment metagenome]
FREFERFERHAEKLRREGNGIDYVSICSPNYLHDAHIRFALRNGAHAICEKPLVISPWNLDALARIEEETGKKVYTVLQLRYHLSALAFSQMTWIKHTTMRVNYCTPRGSWYNHSWKGDEEKSGGLLMNIGIHIFDLLRSLGPVFKITLLEKTSRLCKGITVYEAGYVDVTVHWEFHLGRPEQKTITWGKDGSIDLSIGFNNLHTSVYRDIISGGGYGIEDARPSIELVHKLRGL